MNKKILMSAFLQKLDSYLLKNKPAIWASRMHMVAWYMLLIICLMSAICTSAFSQAKSYTDFEVWIGCSLLFSSLLLIIWIIFLFRFNVFKRFGNWMSLNGVSSLSQLFICVLLISLPCIIPMTVANIIANKQYSSQEITDDINEINLSIYQLEKSVLPKDWTDDTLQLVKKEHLDRINNEIIVVDSSNILSDSLITDPYVNSYKLQCVDSATLAYNLAQSDSVIQIGDSLFLRYTAPNLKFINEYYTVSGFYEQKILSSAQIYRQTLKVDWPDKNHLKLRLKQLKEKYSAGSRYGYASENGLLEQSQVIEDRIRSKYGLENIENGIRNICEKKYFWQKSWPVLIRVMFYSSLAFSLLLFVFRHTTIKTFFLSILSAAILFIILGLFIAVTEMDELAIELTALVLYVSFAIIAYCISFARFRSIIQGICLNFFTLSTPMFPLLVFAIYQTLDEKNYNLKNEGYYMRHTYPEEYLPYVEIAAPIIFLCLLQPVFMRLYRAWYAAPDV